MRPELSSLPKNFRNFYYYKSELADFCRKQGLSPGGNKTELGERVARYIETGEKLAPRAHGAPVCTREKREWFRQRLGKNFHFFVAFAHWLRDNPDKNLEEAARAYLRLRAQGKHRQNPIYGSCQYNAYVRAFFADSQNKGRSLKDAAACWNRKKIHGGAPIYEPPDLTNK